ncbi:hypothetical protein GJT84_00925 [Enterobacteriaceae endosymbiont of Plateumaris sericea]|uniref:SPFH domain-containing protein n=1 Tax=Enterobacteriaceae endosymbiont of Plateumaris sericea TaxID=2675797 RepID=UPI001449A383|nr:SPFH domain-containing protein [Enterobacteriaceae endosymbiont of Plateumaris sericea]QJC29919.1 hypothetical protein GJT84_00925 [Enterobacteriaceae endosymbiont of Plateumaris sericea]
MNKNNSDKKKIKYFLISLLLICLYFFINGFYIIKNTGQGIILRLGKIHNIVSPGLHWKYTFLDKIYFVDTFSVKQIMTDSILLTADLNLVNIKIMVEYKIYDPLVYTFSNNDLLYSFKQSINSVLNEVIGNLTINYILTKNNNIISNEIKNKLQLIIKKYNFGINILDVYIENINIPKED